MNVCYIRATYQLLIAIEITNNFFDVSLCKGKIFTPKTKAGAI